MLLRSKDTYRAHRSAFTLLEILVVAAIVTMLAGAGVYYFVNQLDDSKVSRAKLDCQGLAQRCEEFYTKHGRYPASIEELTQQVDGMSPLVPADKITDPWGNKYQLEPPQDEAAKRVVVYTQYKGQKVSNLDVK
jgi:general secretion pathway protein G